MPSAWCLMPSGDNELTHPTRLAACDAAGLASVVESLSGVEWVFWVGDMVDYGLPSLYLERQRQEARLPGL